MHSDFGDFGVVEEYEDCEGEACEEEEALEEEAFKDEIYEAVYEDDADEEGL